MDAFGDGEFVVAHLDRDVVAFTGEERPVEAQGEVHDGGGRLLHAPAGAVGALGGEFGGERLEGVPGEGLARGDLDARVGERVGVHEDHIGLQQGGGGDHGAVGGGDGLPDVLGDRAGDLLAQVRAQVGQVTLLGEAHDVGGLVVDDVGRGAALELGDELVVDVVPAALDEFHHRAGVGLVPGGDDVLRRGDGRVLEGQGLELEGGPVAVVVADAEGRAAGEREG